MILIYEQDLTHYRASFYDFLSKLVDEEVLILYGKGEPDSSHIFDEGDERRSFSTRPIKRTWIGKSLYFQSLKEVRLLVKQTSISCVIHRGAIRNLGLLREIAFFKRQGIPVILRGIGYSVRREFNPNMNFVDRIHQKIVNSSDAYLCYTDGSKKILDRFCSPEKIIVAVNTLNSEILTNHYNRLCLLGKKNVKMELNLVQEKYIIHVGRLTSRKKIDHLINIYSYIKSRTESIGLILIGDGPNRIELQKQVDENNIQDVIFTGALPSEDIITSKYIFAADLMVIPGNIGLTANHSFLLGKPLVGHVISKGAPLPKNYIHGPEHEYLIHGYNGLTVSDEDIETYSKAISQVLEDPIYGENALKYAQEHLTVQKMADGYLEAISKVKRYRRG